MSRPTKRRRISHESTEDAPRATSNSVPGGSAFAKSAANWDLEQAYERSDRKDKRAADGTKLPVRTEAGWVQQEESPLSEESGEDEGPDIAQYEQGQPLGEDEDQAQSGEAVPKVPLRVQVREAKEELARCASLVNEDPEEHIGSLRAIAHFADSPVAAVKKLALATQLAVYKDIIPGYRIRPHTDEEAGAKLSKEVRKLRNFEQALVGGYQQYIHTLALCARLNQRASDDEDNGVAAVAIACTCSLLEKVAHFNFRGDLLKIILGVVGGKSGNANFYRCIESLEFLFRTDEDGNASTEAVTMLTKMIKSKDYRVDEAVLNTFLHLRLLTEFSQKGSHEGIDKPKDEDSPNAKKTKEKRQFRTKRQRKFLREQKGLEKDMREADAAVSHEERDRMQAEMLKLVFITYFRILKARTASLTGAALEGLARYAHLINQDFFGDLLEALREIIAQYDEQEAVEGEEEGDRDTIVDSLPDRNASRESLLCAVTAFALLQGQDANAAASSLSLDLNYFITHLYRAVLTACLDPEIESSAQQPLKTAKTDGDSGPQNKVNIQTTTVLLLRSLQAALLPKQNVRAVPPTRVAAFNKNLLTATLQLPEKSCLAMLQLLHKVSKVHGRKVAALWYTEERKGDGTFDPQKSEGGGEGSNPFAATVWEGELLRYHFCPGVRDSIKSLEKSIAQSRT